MPDIEDELKARQPKKTWQREITENIIAELDLNTQITTTEVELAKRAINKIKEAIKGDQGNSR